MAVIIMILYVHMNMVQKKHTLYYMGRINFRKECKDSHISEIDYTKWITVEKLITEFQFQQFK